MAASLDPDGVSWLEAMRFGRWMCLNIPEEREDVVLGSLQGLDTFKKFVFGHFIQ